MKIKMLVCLLALATVFYACRQEDKSAASTKEVSKGALRFTEVQTYRLKKGMSVDSFKVAAENVNLFLDEQPGFIDRAVSMSDSAVLEVAHWTTHDAFSKAQEKAFSDKSALKFFSFVDEVGAMAYFGDEKLVHSNTP
jgi:hypothetical protein